MKKQKRNGIISKLGSRLLVALALLLVLGSCLTACGGGRATITLDPAGIPDINDKNIYGISSDRINLLSEKIAAHADGLTILEELKAAIESYDEQAEEQPDEAQTTEAQTAEEETSAEQPAKKTLGDLIYNVLAQEGLGFEDVVEEDDKKITPEGAAALVGSLVISEEDGSLSSKKVEKITSEQIYGIDSARLENMVENIAEFSKGTQLREQIVAAMNGYDMTAEGFNDDDLPEAQPERAPEFVYNVIKAASDAESPSKEQKTLAEDLPRYEKLTVEGVAAMVESLKTTVSTEAEMDLFTSIFHVVALGFEWLIKVPGFGSFILGLVYFSIAVELLMLPMGIHQQKNSRKQALLRPKEMAIRKKYAGRTDQVTMQKVNREIQEMYQKEGFNPMSGCLPLILSLIIIIPLYNLVIDPMKYMMGASTDVSAALNAFATSSKAAGGLGIELGTSNGTIELLSQIRASGLEGAVVDGLPNFAFFTNGAECASALEPIMGRIPDFTMFGQNFGLNPGLANPWLIIIPALTFASYFVSMKVTRKLSYQPAAQDQATGCSNKTMDFMMPIMSVWFTFMVPAAVGLYWVFKSLIGIAKSFIMAKVMPLPQFTEADFKAAERELAAKEKHRPVKKTPGGNPNVRSLHYIDDEEDDLPPVPPRADTYVEEDDDATEEAGGAYLGEATLKEDDRPEPKKKEKKSKKIKDIPVEDEEFSFPAEDFDTNNQETEDASSDDQV